MKKLEKMQKKIRNLTFGWGSPLKKTGFPIFVQFFHNHKIFRFFKYFLNFLEIQKSKALN